MQTQQVEKEQHTSFYFGHWIKIKAVLAMRKVMGQRKGIGVAIANGECVESKILSRNEHLTSIKQYTTVF